MARRGSTSPSRAGAMVARSPAPEKAFPSALRGTCAGVCTLVEGLFQLRGDRNGEVTMRAISLALIVLLSMSAAFAASGKGGQAAVSLSNASAVISQTSDTAWKLEQTGALNGST